MKYPSTTATVECLPNGLTLILEADDAAPVVSAQVWVGTGSIHEERHLGTGISHFLEHMVFKGTRDMDGPELATTVQAAGGHWNAYTTFDRTVYYIDGPSASLGTFLRALCGMVFFPTLPADEYGREMDVIRREIDMGLDDPDHASTRLLLETAFARDPRRHPVIGHRALFDRLTHQDLVEYHRARYTTDRCHLVISGDIDVDAVRAQVVELTAGLHPGCGIEPFVAHDDPCMAARLARATFAVPTSRLAMAWKTPPAHHPDTPAWELLAAILGRGRSARLYQSLRERDGLALEVSAFAWNHPGRDGLFAVSAESTVENREAVIEAIPREIAALAQHTPQQALDRARRQIAVSQFKILTTASGRAGDLAANWHEARDLDHTQRFIAAMESVTTADIQRLAAGLQSAGRTLTVLDPEDSPTPPRPRKAGGARRDPVLITLGNGLRCAVISDHRAPLVHIHSATLAGQPSEDPAVAGINHLLAAVMPKATRQTAATQLAEELESLGVSMGAGAGNNALTVRASGLADDFPLMVRRFAEVLAEPALAADALAREKATQLAAIEEAALDPMSTAFRTLRAMVFGDAGYGLPSLGTAESLAGIDRDALAAHHHRHLRGANTTVAVVGDIDAGRIAALIEETLGSLPNGDAWRPPASRAFHAGEQSAALPKKQSALAIGYPGVSATDPRRHAMTMLQAYAADMAGPLFTRIREELGLAYQVGATQFHGGDTGLFTCFLATSPEQAALARKELLAETAKLAAHGIPDEAFERVRATVLAGLALQYQSPAGVASHASIDLLFGNPVDSGASMRDAIGRLTPDDVRTVANDVFSAPPAVALATPA